MGRAAFRMKIGWVGVQGEVNPKFRPNLVWCAGEEEAAVDGEGYAGDEAGVVAGEE